MRKILFATLALMVVSCSVGTDKIINKEKLNFSYTDEAYLFFRNMRQSAYDFKAMEEEGLRMYRHEDRNLDITNYYFNAAIVVNWRQNRAFAILELPEEIKKEGLQIIWVDQESGEGGQLTMPGLTRKDELEFLTEVYNHIIQEHTLQWKPEGNEYVPLFSNNDYKEAFRITMYDFYRLTGVL